FVRSEDRDFNYEPIFDCLQNYVECNLFLSGIKVAVLAPHSCTAKIDNIAYFPNLQQQDSIPGKDWQRVNFWIRRYGCCYPF
ncbi:hypothetical protein, partial [Bacteroides uniformis]